MRYARIYPWRRTRRSRAPSNGPDAFFVAQFSAGYTTNMFGFDLRQGQVLLALSFVVSWGKCQNTEQGVRLRDRCALFISRISAIQFPSAVRIADARPRVEIVIDCRPGHHVCYLERQVLRKESRLANQHPSADGPDLLRSLRT